MKKQVLILAIASLFLSSCGGNSSIVRDNSGSSGNSEISADDDVAEKLVSGIGAKEYDQIIVNSKEHAANIVTANIAYGKSIYTYDDAGSKSKTDYRLANTQQLFTNSVLVNSYTGSKKSDFQQFGLYDESYGVKKEEYYYLDDGLKHIMSTNVYSNSEKTSVIQSELMPYTLENYDLVFSVVSEEFILDPNEAGVILVVAGKLDDGRVYARYEVNRENNGDSDGLTLLEYCDFYFTNSLLTTSKIITKRYSASGLDESLTTCESNYSVNTNGVFDKTTIPTAK